ncbi:hypothetical protein HYPSUDRAFT_374588 [Hypholoma sublateritium FD-334 SS-4]|uniref:Uncharacterized protein n=1 Tax=Hypholoma sublateritium (strain FD-334 SS-4) TaxID=945553 RepID=A0A0D2MP80_HYPSF|nr:hypothetical protein HYPSUDRAFT_374588 [Hypholoma sublateritium FD-334 SS-4]
MVWSRLDLMLSTNITTCANSKPSILSTSSIFVAVHLLVFLQRSSLYHINSINPSLLFLSQSYIPVSCTQPHEGDVGTLLILTIDAVIYF